MQSRFALLMVTAASLSACSVLPDSHGHQASAAASAPRSIAPPVAVNESERQCLAQLGQSGVQFSPLPDRYTGDGCSQVGTVQMSALQSDYASLGLTNIGPVQCGVAETFAGWARYGVDRAARQLLGSGVERIETFGSYSCRNVAGSSKRSGHATAAAIDVAAFVLEDGRRISVKTGWNGGSAAEKEFLRTVEQSACKRFGTVLGPNYNAAHQDHFHVEGVIEGSSYCR